MIKTLCLALLFLLLASDSVFGQTAPRSIVLDIPILTMRKIIHVQRIKDGNLNLGPTLDPWEKNVIYRVNLAPELVIASSDNRLYIAGGFARAYDEGRRRDNNFLDVAVDRRVWKLSTGVSGFVEGEDINDVFEIVDLTADFSRLSLGARGWSGIKIGSFSNNFFVLNLGGGYIKTHGDFTYRHPVLVDIDPIELYREDFQVYTVTAEGRKVHRRISLHGKLEGMRYSNPRAQRAEQSSYDGARTFNDLNVHGTIEVVPLLRFNTTRVLVKVNSNLQKYESLLFRTSEPELQVYLRIKFR